MASAATPETALPLLDLSFLNEEERIKIERVLQADQELRTKDKIRLGTLRQEVAQSQHHQKELKDKRQCACCEQPFGRFFNTGANCPVCGSRVCKQCRKIPYNRGPPAFICTVCAKKRLLDLQASSRVPVSPTQSTTLYGSELVRVSLEATKKKAQTFPRSSPRPSTTSAGSQGSPIVVRYSVAGENSGTPLATADSERRSSVSSATKASLGEFSDSDQEDEPLQLLPPPGLEVLRRSDSLGSIGSMASMYSASAGKGDYDITGEVLVGLWHKDDQLFIRVMKAKGLAAAKKSGTSDPYVKTYLLPDRTKHTKRKTGAQRKTLNPVYNEVLKNKIPRHDVTSHTLWLSVWDWDRFGRNQFLGEVRQPLSMVDLTNSKDRWYKLQDKDESARQADLFYRGKLHLGLMFVPDDVSTKASPARRRSSSKLTKGTLHIQIKKAEELPVMDANSLTDATVKFYLLPNQNSSGKRKTKVVKNSLNPTWDEHFTYNTSLEELMAKRVLEVTVWDYDRRGSNDFIGGLRLGPAPGHTPKHKEWMDSIGDEVSHWEAALAHPGEWVEQWHTLRPSMDPLGPGATPIVFPVRATRAQELSPVEEASPTHEKGEGLPTLETYSFSPPITPESLSQAPPTFPQALPIGGTAISVPEVIVTQSTPRRDPTVEALVGSQALAKRRDSLGSTGSLYSENECIKGDYVISGEVRFGVFYKDGQLVVHLSRARGLAAANSNGFSDPYVKTYLLPDKSKHSKRKTTIKRKTLDPVYNEILKYKVSRTEATSHTLWLSVWDWDRFGRNQFLGEVRLPLSSADLNDKEDHWHTLQDREEGTEEGSADAFYRGQLMVGLMFQRTDTKKGKQRGTLNILIKQARELPNMDSKGLTDGFVKCYLLPDKSSGGKRKTGVVKNNLNPVWGEQFSYEKVILDELSSERVLQLTVWDLNKGSSSDFIGGLRLGPAPGRTTKHKEWMDSIGDEVSHWEAALAHPGEWVEQWHTLRTTMDPRSVAHE